MPIQLPRVVSIILTNPFKCQVVLRFWILRKANMRMTLMALTLLIYFGNLLSIINEKNKILGVDGGKVRKCAIFHFFLFFHGTQLFPINSLSYRKVQITYRKKRLGFCKAIYAGHTLFNRITVKINFETWPKVTIFTRWAEPFHVGNGVNLSMRRGASWKERKTDYGSTGNLLLLVVYLQSFVGMRKFQRFSEK